MIRVMPENMYIKTSDVRVFEALVDIRVLRLN